jgi:hypothetical protein
MPEGCTLPSAASPLVEIEVHCPDKAEKKEAVLRTQQALLRQQLSSGSQVEFSGVLFGPSHSSYFCMSCLVKTGFCPLLLPCAGIKVPVSFITLISEAMGQRWGGS